MGLRKRACVYLIAVCSNHAAAFGRIRGIILECQHEVVQLHTTQRKWLCIQQMHAKRGGALVGCTQGHWASVSGIEVQVKVLRCIGQGE